MRKIIKEYFSFSRRERNGIFFLLILIGILFLCLSFMDSFLVNNAKVDFSEFENEIIAFTKADSNKFNNVTRGSSDLFYFNPNNLSEKEWKQLGLTEKQIKTIKKYESRGGKFFKKEDLKKIYVISNNDYNRLESYIIIPETSMKQSFPSGKFNSNTFSGERKKDSLKTNIYKYKIDINVADSTELIRLNGIGPILAARIIKYRNKLGGFIKKEQLQEVYGMDSLKYLSILNQIIIKDNLKIRSMNINKASFAQLKQHPYISYNIANAIVNYRKQHGDFNKNDEIKNIDLINDELYFKLEPYININEN